MKVSELDKIFDDNQEDIKEAKRVGVSRQAVIKMWLAEKLQSLNTTAATI